MLALLVLALAPAATSVAVLPVGAEQLSLDVVPVLEKIDADLRAAVSQEATLAVQDAEVTKAQVIGARSIGVACGPTDAACLAKLCALAGVDRVVGSLAKFGDDGTISIHLVVVEAGGASATTDGVLPAAEAARSAEVRAIVKRAAIATRPTASVIAPTPPDPTPTPTPTPAPAPEPTPEPTADAPAPTLFLAGVAVAATGGAIALGSGIGAFVLDMSLAEPEDYADREPKMVAGRALVVVAGASTLVAAAGAALIVVSSVTGAE